MSFTDQLPFTATDEHFKLRWNCRSPGEDLRCGFCGYKFKPGDKVRWLYTNDLKGAGGNPFVCSSCDKPNDILKEQWLKMCEEARTKYWFFTRREVY